MISARDALNQERNTYLASKPIHDSQSHIKNHQFVQPVCSIIIDLFHNIHTSPMFTLKYLSIKTVVNHNRTFSN